jgi:hypothetical protein
MPSNSHYFHAEAHALSGKLTLPFEEEIKKQAFVKLEGNLNDLPEEERAERNYFSQHGKNFRLEGIISYAAAHTQVSGHASKKNPGASVTLATSAIEDLNVLNVVTADRVVGQISATHFPNESAPEITFLGTHFENLRIARHRAEPYLKLDLAGHRPGGKTLYVEKGTSLMSAAEKQYGRLKAWLEGLPSAERNAMASAGPAGSLTKKYYGGAPNYANLRAEAISAREKDAKTGDGKSEGITCSLVENVEIKDMSAKAADGNPVQIPPPAKSFGHVIHIPDFGTIFLAELTVNHNSFRLTMVRLEMGCLADGNVSAGVTVVNGGGGKGGGN